MSSHNALQQARNEKNDEFYTQLVDIERELGHYRGFLTGKVIYLPCDDPHFSQFFTYFVQHFKELELKSLIATCYDAAFDQLSLFEDYDEKGQLIAHDKHAYLAVINDVKQETTLEELARNPANSLTLLKGNGDFASEECVARVKEADVIITNPPFSLFRGLLHLLHQLNKDYVLLGASLAIGYRETFGLFLAHKLFVGFSPFPSRLWFRVPRGSPYDKEEAGRFYKKVPVGWYTSFPVRPERKPLSALKSYSPPDYPLVAGESFIFVESLAAIPKDYTGKMAVPLTFLGVWNPDEYDILGKTEKVFVHGEEKFKRLIIQKKEDTHGKAPPL